MPTRTESRCCLTLSRAQWKLLDELLSATRHPVSVPCRQAIREALAKDSSERVGIDRELDKWASVLSAVHDAGCRRGGEFNWLIREMVRQASAAATEDW